MIAPYPHYPGHTVVRQVAPTEQKYVIASLVLAFHNDPASRWLYPDPHQYLTYFPKFLKAFGGKAFDHNTVHCCNNYAGAALWYPPDIEPDIEPVVQLVQKSVLQAKQSDVFSVFEQMDRYHPKYPHWYLAFIGVEPTQQSKGHGSALMRSVLKTCDRDRVPAYLESSKPTNLSFYQRHGFEVLGTIQVGTSPPIFPMLRRPL
ncbi:GNAT family N-acetyltransferase [Leptolyngbya cf. ectocarpi LEGE 11479]|uniref:GNAT family N-acetyltransferase n=2 Tax=Leptolyngbya ectocarpi TaxID=1202 RepID=A0A929FC13_LEPEC|nr:GNAT family N-acetyltransferase [Leptolyngbya cf. ectocarpi LEGE 11479]